MGRWEAGTSRSVQIFTACCIFHSGCCQTSVLAVLPIHALETDRADNHVGRLQHGTSTGRIENSLLLANFRQSSARGAQACPRVWQDAAARAPTDTPVRDRMWHSQGQPSILAGTRWRNRGPSFWFPQVCKCQPTICGAAQPVKAWPRKFQSKLMMLLHSVSRKQAPATRCM